MAKKHEPDIKAADVLRMFPTFVWRAELGPEVHQRLNGTIVRKLDQIRQTLPALVPGQAWQSDQALHKLDEFHELVSCVNSTIENVLDFLKITAVASEITAFWANMSAPGAGHGMHSHPNNFLSGVYYVQAHEGADTVNFHDPRSQT